MPTSDADRALLLAVAREAITAHVHRRSAPPVPIEGVLARFGGAFVSLHARGESLHARGELRGCIGHLEANQPLGEVIARCAVAACSTDPRFPAVAPDELGNLVLEVSLLGAFEAVGGPESIEIGRHGLLIESGGHRGLLLPQVATEWDWDRETFLAHTCLKAGLARDAWRRDVKLWRFEAEVFGEE
jgi:AmmeMemoRadiSam system protein A